MVKGLVHFLTWVTSWTGQITQMWVSCKPQTTSPTPHTGVQLFNSVGRQSGGQRVLPSQDNTAVSLLGSSRLKNGGGRTGNESTWMSFLQLPITCVIHLQTLSSSLVLLCNGWTSHIMYTSRWAEHQALALTRCCHAKSIHGACKRHTVQVSLHSLFS